MVIIGAVSQASGFSLALDSVRTWGKFPRFCVDTYRWGDHFFNGYDTAYVVGTGYKFNTKIKLDSWINTYQFFLPDNVKMYMTSEPTTSAGLWLTYLAVSGGYTKNISHLFGHGTIKTREEYAFGFNCSLFAFNMSYVTNTGGVTITRFGAPHNKFDPDIPFDGLKSSTFNVDTYYFFNHKRYSQAAPFSFSRKQIRSQGSWFAGLSYSLQRFKFDFNDMPIYITEALPAHWENNTYRAKTKNLAIKFGYGYNWVFRPKWVFAVSESPTIGLKKGIINNPDKETTTMTFSNQLKAAVVWNHNEWFAGLTGELNIAIYYDKGSAFQNSFLTGTMCLGYRFNIW